MSINELKDRSTESVQLKTKRVIFGLIVPVLVLGAWELSVLQGRVSSVFFPPPSKLLELAVSLSADGIIWLHFFSTMSRLLPAFFFGATLGVILGLVLGSSQTARSLFEPSMLGIYSVPKIALLPIFLAIFGVGESALIALVATSVFFYVWIYTMAAVMRAPANLALTAQVFGATRPQIVRGVLFRAALPETMVGVRVGITVALLVCLTAEYILGSSGIGYLILGSRSLGQHGQSYIGIIVAALTGLSLQWLIKKLDKIINPWVIRNTYAGHNT
jgi:sulfonate transport system permease protein